MTPPSALHLFPLRTVLELGSGVGLTGVAICRSCRPSRYIFTDCHPSVLRRLKDNVRLNGLTEGTTPGVSVEELDWMEATEERLEQIRADVVIAAGCTGILVSSPNMFATHPCPWDGDRDSLTPLPVFVPCAADVVYDPDVAAGLVTLLSKILHRSSPQVFVCSTIRNPETYGGFKKRLGENKKHSAKFML